MIDWYALYAFRCSPRRLKINAKDVARRGDTLTGRAANTKGEGLTHRSSRLKQPELLSMVLDPPASQRTWPWLQGRR
jgi:hypothetical protein